MINSSELSQAVNAIKKGRLIIYPTEAVFGLGCDPFNQKAVVELLALKQRSADKGLILIASHVQQILPLIKPKQPSDLARALKTWPGHMTWVFPKSNLVPSWVSGAHNSVAVRVSHHPVVKQICDELMAPIVSTSANVSKQGCLNSIKNIKSQFDDKIHLYLDAKLGGEKSSSRIKDAHTNKILR